MAATREPGAALKTMALGSCVAIVMLDPATKSVGMAHIALPDSSINSEKRKVKPGYFADSAIPVLLDRMRDSGSFGNPRLMTIKIIGGANVLGSSMIFDIGNRNIAAIKSILASYGANVAAEDTGGNNSRTVSVDVDTGSILIYCPGLGQWSV